MGTDARLMDSVLSCDVEGVRAALAAGGDPNQREPDERRRSLLHVLVCAWWMQSEAPEAHGLDHMTEAAVLEIVGLLVEAGADIRAQEHSQGDEAASALSEAWSDGLLSVVDRMLSAEKERGVYERS